MHAARPMSPPPIASETIERTPNDGNFGLQWGLRNTQQFLGSIAARTSRRPKHGTSHKARSVSRSPSLTKACLLRIPNFAGKVLTGYNALNGSSNTFPKTNDHHGTAMAGIIAAHSDNGAGISGICWFCQTLACQSRRDGCQRQLGHFICDPRLGH